MESSSNPLNSEEDQTRNWLDLPRDVTAMILQKLNSIEIITSAQLVCSLWRNICKDPLMWRTIDMQNSGDPYDMPKYLESSDLGSMCYYAIDRSCGQLVDINIEHFGTDSLLYYISYNACQLRRLRLLCCFNISDEGLSEAVVKLPMLEELDMSMSSLSKDSLAAVGRNCPLLKSLKFNKQGYRRPRIECDKEAFAIAENMPGLRHLQLFGNKLTNVGLLAILDGCRHLESLDLRQCFNVNLVGSLGRRCAEQNIYLRLPNDPTDDCPFDVEIHDYGLIGDPFEDDDYDYQDYYWDLTEYDNDYEYFWDDYHDYRDWTGFDNDYEYSGD